MAWEDIPGWWNHYHSNFYQAAAEKIHNGEIVEVGAYCGRSTLSIAPICKANNTKIIVVDDWRLPLSTDNMEIYYHDFIRKFPPDVSVYDIFLGFVERERFLDTIIPIRGRSLDVVVRYLLSGHKFDMVFLDGDHEYPATKWDILSWMQVIKPGGILAGHDYVPRWPGVIQAVKEIFPKGFNLSPPAEHPEEWKIWWVERGPNTW